MEKKWWNPAVSCYIYITLLSVIKLVSKIGLVCFLYSQFNVDTSPHLTLCTSSQRRQNQEPYIILMIRNRLWFIFLCYVNFLIFAASWIFWSKVKQIHCQTEASGGWGINFSGELDLFNQNEYCEYLENLRLTTIFRRIFLQSFEKTEFNSEVLPSFFRFPKNGSKII